MALLDELLARPAAPAIRRKALALPDFTTQIEVGSNTAEVVIQDTPGTVTEGRAREFLEAEGLDPSAFTVSSFKKSMWGDEANPKESVAFTFKRVSVETRGLELPDLDDLHAAIAREAKLPKAKVHTKGRTVLGVIADAQVGKVDHRGGVEELLARLEASRLRWIEYLKEHQPEEIVLLDGGDSIENFENTGSQDRTNDLQLTEQIRLWRRIFWRWIETAAMYAPSVKVISVPSNHCSIRRGKANLSVPSDDYGIEVLAQVRDMASVYPEKFGHVEFFSPPDYQESIAIELAGGKVLGAAHGHQVSKPEGFPNWLAGQALGRTPIGEADIIIFNHFHNLRVQTVGDDRWMFIAPTSDSGSSWFRTISGNESAPGVMTMVIESDGWRALHVC